MSSESIIQALSGSSLVKLALAIAFGVSCLVLRRKETEGVFTRFAFLALFLVLRDIAYFFFPVESLFRASDLLLFGIIAYIALMPKGGWAFWASIAAVFFAILLLLVKDLFGLAPGLSPEVFRFFAAAPIFAFMFGLRIEANETAPGRLLLARIRFPLALASLAYLVLGSILGSTTSWFQSLVLPAYYGFFLWFGPGLFRYRGRPARQGRRLLRGIDR